MLKIQFKIKPGKMRFFQNRDRRTFLGHSVRTGRVLLPDKSKLKVIEQYPSPTDKDAVKRFVAFANVVTGALY